MAGPLEKYESIWIISLTTDQNQNKFLKTASTQCFFSSLHFFFDVPKTLSWSKVQFQPYKIQHFVPSQKKSLRTQKLNLPYELVRQGRLGVPLFLQHISPTIKFEKVIPFWRKKQHFSKGSQNFPRVFQWFQGFSKVYQGLNLGYPTTHIPPLTASPLLAVFASGNSAAFRNLFESSTNIKGL